jgi:hypothetical protein
MITPYKRFPEYIFLGNNSSLDNNNFEYLFIPKYFFLLIKDPWNLGGR